MMSKFSEENPPEFAENDSFVALLQTTLKN